MESQSKIIERKESFICPADKFHCTVTVIFTARKIFHVVLRKCYKIKVPRGNFYLEWPYNFSRTFFSVYKIVSNSFKCECECERSKIFSVKLYFRMG